MDYNYLAQTIAKSAFTTSDSGAYKLHGYLKSTELVDEVLKEYVYFKAFLGIYKFKLIAKKIRETAVKGEYSGNADEDIANCNNIIPSIYSILGKAFENDSFGYGCNILELKERVRNYTDLVENGCPFDKVFYDYLEGTVDVLGIFDKNIVCAVQQEAMNYMDKAFNDGSSGKGKRGNGGCLSVLACTLLFVIVVCSLI